MQKLKESAQRTKQVDFKSKKGEQCMTYDYSKLKGQIVYVCGSQGVFAEKMNITKTTLSNKLNNKVTFTQDEIAKAVEVLSISPKEIDTYFFTPIVENK